MKTEVMTSYTTGTTINLGACEALDFLSGIAMSTIIHCRERITVNKTGVWIAQLESPIMTIL